MDQEQAFYELLDNHISCLSDKKREKYLITQQLYDQILDVVNQSVGVKNDRMMTTLLKVMVFIKICNKCIKTMNL